MHTMRLVTWEQREATCHVYLLVALLLSRLKLLYLLWKALCSAVDRWDKLTFSTSGDQCVVITACSVGFHPELPTCSYRWTGKMAVVAAREYWFNEWIVYFGKFFGWLMLFFFFLMKFLASLKLTCTLGDHTVDPQHEDPASHGSKNTFRCGFSLTLPPWRGECLLLLSSSFLFFIYLLC